MLRDIPLRIQLLLALFLLGLIPILIISWVGYETARSEMKEQTFHHLASVRDIKAEQIRRFFEERREDLRMLAENPYVIEAFQQLQKVFFDAPPQDQFQGFGQGRFKAPTNYTLIHNRLMPELRRLSTRIDTYDILFIDAATARIVFTLQKESDFSTNLNKHTSALAMTFKAALAIDRPSLSDTQLYAPSSLALAQFIACPLRKEGQIIGVIATQLTLQRIDAIMSERSGLGRTGETYLIGSDRRMRSDSFLDPIGHSVKASLLDPSPAHGVDTDSARMALQGLSGSHICLDYRGQKVLSAFSPLQVEPLNWAIIAEIDQQEIDQQISKALNRRLIWLIGLSTILLLTLALLFSSQISRGISKVLKESNGLIQAVLAGELEKRSDPDLVPVDFRHLIRQTNQLLESFSCYCREKQELQQQLWQFQRLDAIGTLAGGIAHDLNNLLTHMHALLHIMRMETNLSEKSEESALELTRTIDHSAGLVQQILSFSRENGNLKEKIDLNLAIAEAAALLRLTQPVAITIEVLTAPQPLMVLIEPTQLQQIILNIALNACQAMTPARGHLKLKTLQKNVSNDELPPLAPGPYASIIFANNGPRIPPEVARRMFEPFFSYRIDGHGSGLGLAVVKAIVMHHNGLVRFISREEQDTAFEVLLPI